MELEASEKLFKEFAVTSEDAVQDDNHFLYFYKFDRKFVHFQFSPEKGIVAETRQLKDAYSRNILRTDGFKVIQTPLSNRIFLIGGDDHPHGTFEFDLKNNCFFPEDEMPRLFVSLTYGRSHHSLAATSGLIFCTGGKAQFLDYQNNNPNDEILPRIIEVLKLKDNMWVQYTNRLMVARYAHSSWIVGRYLYVFLGYDANDRIHNMCPIERVWLNPHESQTWENTNCDVHYNVNQDQVDRFFRSFSSIAPLTNNKHIICFGYEGLEPDCLTPAAQQSLYKNPKFSHKQHFKKYKLTDHYMRYREVGHMLTWELHEEIDSQQEDSIENLNNEYITSIEEDNILEEEYTHSIIQYRGMVLLPTMHDNKERLIYFNDTSERFCTMPTFAEINDN